MDRPDKRKHSLKSNLMKRSNLNPGKRKTFTSNKCTQTENSGSQDLFNIGNQPVPHVEKIGQEFGIQKDLNRSKSANSLSTGCKYTSREEGTSSTSVSVFPEKLNNSDEAKNTKSSSKAHMTRFDNGNTDRNQGIPVVKRVRRDILILRDEDYPVYWNDIKISQDLGESNYWNSYFNSFASIGIVMIRPLNNNFTTSDIYNELCKHIIDPFVLISEKNPDGFLHWHMIWLTTNNADEAKQLLLTYMQLKGFITYPYRPEDCKRQKCSTHEDFLSTSSEVKIIFHETFQQGGDKIFP
ncbi:hypothetical protein AVEN_187194-1 [Araneus ventricosus]|uniref:Uncharacterized protein n=1 Tax=Araneus ventricosus TaxID=182803 RepID=A0A4Y2MIQ8_ARAVE|nr:hypothetical protein AVEN_187194-1 [Araneus ventricosus]